MNLDEYRTSMNQVHTDKDMDQQVIQTVLLHKKPHHKRPILKPVVSFCVCFVMLISLMFVSFRKTESTIFNFQIHIQAAHKTSSYTLQKNKKETTVKSKKEIGKDTIFKNDIDVSQQGKEFLHNSLHNPLHLIIEGNDIESITYRIENNSEDSISFYQMYEVSTPQIQTGPAIFTKKIENELPALITKGNSIAGDPSKEYWSLTPIGNEYTIDYDKQKELRNLVSLAFFKNIKHNGTLDVGDVKIKIIIHKSSGDDVIEYLILEKTPDNAYALRPQP